MPSNPQICAEDEIFINEDCECDDCLSQKLDEIIQVLNEYYENLDTELLSQLTAIKDNFSNYYNQAQVDELLEQARGVTFVKVDTLPNKPEDNVIYLLNSADPQENCKYSKWFVVDGEWESMVCGEDTALLLHFYAYLETTGETYEESFTYVNSGTFPGFDYELPEDYTFNGWVCGDTTYQPDDPIPTEWFEDGAPCDVIEADITEPRTLVLQATFVGESVPDVNVDVEINGTSETITLEEALDWTYESPLQQEDNVSVTWEEITGYTLETTQDGDTYTAVYTEGTAPTGTVIFDDAVDPFDGTIILDQAIEIDDNVLFEITGLDYEDLDEPIDMSATLLAEDDTDFELSEGDTVVTISNWENNASCDIEVTLNGLAVNLPTVDNFKITILEA